MTSPCSVWEHDEGEATANDPVGEKAMKMKMKKRFASLSMVAVLGLAMSAPAWADEEKKPEAPARADEAAKAAGDKKGEEVPKEETATKSLREIRQAFKECRKAAMESKDRDAHKECKAKRRELARANREAQKAAKKEAREKRKTCKEKEKSGRKQCRKDVNQWLKQRLAALRGRRT